MKRHNEYTRGERREETGLEARKERAGRMPALFLSSRRNGDTSVPVDSTEMQRRDILVEGATGFLTNPLYIFSLEFFDDSQ